MIPLGVMAGAHVPAASGWTPADLTTLAGWWSADTLTLSDGAPVNSWADQSSAGNNMTVDPVGGPPTYIATGRAGLPVVRFDGSNDLLNAPGATDDTFTLVAVLSMRAGGGPVKTVMGVRGATTTPASAAGHVGGHAVTNGSYTRGLYGLGKYVTYTGGAATVGSWSRWTLDSTVALRVNDVAAQTGDTFKAGATDVLVGSAKVSTGNLIEHPGAFDLAEIVLCSTVLGATDRANLDAYLADKWGF